MIKASEVKQCQAIHVVCSTGRDRDHS